MDGWWGMNLLGFLYLFAWPFLLPAICVLVLSLIRRTLVVRVAALMAFFVLISAVPIAYTLATSAYPDGLALSSLSLYPFSLAALVVTLLSRLLLIRLRTRGVDRI